MRNFKKVLSLVLCLAMMLSVMVVGAGAAFKDQEKIVNTEAVDMCVALNIINGYTDGSYKPEGNVTRAEMCKMICIALNGGKEPATATKAVPTYSDIDGHWAEGYIEYCNTKGIVAGVGGGKFNPNGNVTGSQAAKMLLVALGYNADVEKYTGASWELYVNVQANQDGLYTDLETMDPSAALSRDNAAQMIWNTLQAYVINKSSSIDRTDGSVTDIYEKSTTVDLLKKAYNANDEHEGTLVGFIYNDTKGEWTYRIQEAGDSSTTDGQVTSYEYHSYKSSTDYTGLYGQYVSVVYKETANGGVDSVYGIYADADDCQVLTTGLIGDFSDVTNKDSVKIDGTTYDLDKNASAVPVYYFEYGTNHLASVGSIYNLAQESAVSLDAFAFAAIDRDSDDDIDSFVVYPFAVGQVNLLNATKIGIKDLDASKADNVAGKATETLDLDKIDVYSGVAKNDFVVYTPAKYTATNTASVAKVDAVLNGSVTKVSGSDITIDGTVYTNYDKNATYTAGTKVSDGAVVNGYIFTVDATGSVSVEDYAVVTAKSDGTNSVSGAQAKLLLSDGSKVVVDIKNFGGAVKGDLVTYTKNSSDEYTLTVVNPVVGAGTGTGFDKVVAKDYNMSSPVPGDVNSSNKIKYIQGNVIADDAVIFVKDTDGFKTITGAQLKTTSAAGITVENAFADTVSSSGYDTIKLAYVSTTASLKSASSQYGYVVASPAIVENADGDKVTELQIWNGSETVTLNTADNALTNLNAVAKRSVIEYTVNSDGEIDGISVVIASNNSAAAVVKPSSYPGVGVGAISAYDGTYVRFQGDDNRYEITKDTVIFYIDNDAVVGYSEGSIQLGSDKTTAEKYKNACVIVDNTDKEIDLLVVDINNDIENAID